MTEPPSETADLDTLFRDLSRELWAIFYSQCSDPERAYDAVQEAFLRYHAHEGEAIRDARAWLLRVGINWLRDVARLKSSSTRQSDALNEIVQSRLSSDENLMSEENRYQIREALRDMIEDDRKVLVMKYSLNWSAAQMGKAMLCSAAAIDMRLSRARRRLAELLEEKGFKHD